MKKEILIATAALVFAATPVFAANSHSDNANNSSDNRVNVQATDHDSDTNRGEQPTITQKPEQENDNEDTNIKPTNSPTVSPSVTSTPSTTCDRDGDFKNHGQFVSCVAHLHLGGEAVEEAAHSDIGKHHDNKPTPSVSPSPSATPSVSPTATPTVSPTPVTSAMSTFFGGVMPIKNLGLLISRFVDFIKHLL